MSSDLPGLPQAVLELLEAEQGREGAPAAARRELFDRLAQSIPTLAPTGGGGSQGSDGSQRNGGNGPGDAPGRGSEGLFDAATAAGRGTLGRMIAVGVVGLGLGAGAGVALDRAVMTKTDRVVVVEKRVEVVVPAAPAPSRPPAPAESVPDVVPRTAAPVLPAGSTSQTPRAGRDTPLANERSAIEVARTSLARGDAQAALAATERHRKEHPHGQLVEEREAIAIQALASLGRASEARERAARFNNLYPRSMLLPLVEEAVHAAP